jgi:hypothetical protein
MPCGTAFSVANPFVVSVLWDASVLRHLLAHSDLRTTTKYYNCSKGIEANEKAGNLTGYASYSTYSFLAGSG